MALNSSTHPTNDIDRAWLYFVTASRHADIGDREGEVANAQLANAALQRAGRFDNMRKTVGGIRGGIR